VPVGVRCILFAVLLALLTGSPALHADKTRIRYATVDGNRYLFLSDVATYYGMRYSRAASSKQVCLSSRYSRLVFTLDDRATTLNDVSVYLGLPVRTWQSNPVVSNADFQLLIDPVLRTGCLPRSNAIRVMIDPGHGGKDPGTKGDRLKQQEKDVTLALASLLRAELARRGYQVALTRSSDQTLALEQRPAQASSWRADLFISLHANYVGTPSVRGIESFRMCPKDTKSTYGNTTNSSTHPGNACDRRNTRLAYEVQKALLQATGAPDRGVRQANFLVLREASCPAMLVEVGYMSNAKEEKLLAAASYRAKIAVGIANGIDRFRQAVGPQP